MAANTPRRRRFLSLRRLALGDFSFTCADLDLAVGDADFDFDVDVVVVVAVVAAVKSARDPRLFILAAVGGPTLMPPTFGPLLLERLEKEPHDFLELKPCPLVDRGRLTLLAVLELD